MLLNILQCTGHPATENGQAPDVSSAEAGMPAFESEVQTATSVPVTRAAQALRS